MKKRLIIPLFLGILFVTVFKIKTVDAAATNQSGILTINYVPGYGVALWQNYGSSKIDTGQKLQDGTAWKFSSVKSVDGNNWYEIGNNKWVSSEQGATLEDPTVEDTGIARINYIPGYSISVWNSYDSSRQTTGEKLKHGTEWNFFEKKIDSSGNSWYKVGNNQWIQGEYTKITNNDFPMSSAKIWDPNWASLKVVQTSPIYSSSNSNSKTQNTVNSGSIIEITSTVLSGNTIWYELSNGGWVPSNVVEEITTQRSRVQLNGQSKDQVIQNIISVAKQQLGKPYVWDGRGPNGFDCSGLMQYVFKQVTGQNIGSWTVPQESSGVKVDLNHLQAGDLLFWGSQGATYHVGLYLGNNQYLNALRPGTNIKIDYINNSFAPSFGVRVFP